MKEGVPMRRVWCVLVLVLGGTFLGAQQSDEWYLGKPIKDITFEGLHHVSISELEGITAPYIGRFFTDTLFWELQGKLYALEYFDTITPRAIPADEAAQAVILKFIVKEKPVVSRIQFQGNTAIRSGELQDAITIKQNEVVNTIKLRADEQAIRNKYLEKGYPDVSVKSQVIEGPSGKGQNTVEVRFLIEEGERVIVEAIRFEGNTVFSENTLRAQLSLKPKSLFNDGAFQEAKLIADQHALIQYYRNRGYVDARVVDVYKQTRKDEQGKNLMTLTFKIFEGKMYTLGKITFEGNKLFPTKQLESLISAKPQQPINAQRLEADIQRVADLYYENGYIFNTITRNEKRNEEIGTIDYTITIVERPRAYIENIIIRGNKKTKEAVILREIPLEPGDIFSKNKVIDGLRNLYNLQYFSSIVPDTPQGSAENLMNLVFTVEEQPTTDVQFGLTFSGSSDPKAFPISGLLKYNDRNFLGGGNTIGLELTASPNTQLVSFTYTERWMFGIPLSGSYDFSFNHSTKTALMDSNAPFFNGDEDYAYPDGFDSYEQYINSDKTPLDEYLMSYDQWKFSLGFSTGYRFGTPVGNLNVGGGLRLGIVYNSYDDTLYRPFDPTLRKKNNRWVPSNSLWAMVSFDNRDISYDPSSGFYAIQRLGLYGLFPADWEHYLRTDTKAEYFLTLFKFPISESFTFKGVLGLHSGISFIFPQIVDGTAQIEDSNKLVIDGMFIGRGWYSMRLTYGMALWENWAELRFPLVPNVLALDWFFDAAALKKDYASFINSLTIEDFRFSFGAGLRFTIPQFPFRFSLAKRFKVADNQIQWQDGGIGSWGLDFVLSFALSSY
ncbi:MAG: outer membrane protein assembly factor BamA [Treponemataceae bacterium]|nr:outer membrane protein assembly factor BamA [Treponemataceae bacterium]